MKIRVIFFNVMLVVRFCNFIQLLKKSVNYNWLFCFLFVEKNNKKHLKKTKLYKIKRDLYETNPNTTGYYLIVFFS